MATRNSTGVERGCGRQAGNRQRTCPRLAGRKVAKSRPTSAKRQEMRIGGAL